MSTFQLYPTSTLSQRTKSHLCEAQWSVVRQWDARHLLIDGHALIDGRLLIDGHLLMDGPVPIERRVLINGRIVLFKNLFAYHSGKKIRVIV